MKIYRDDEVVATIEWSGKIQSEDPEFNRLISGWTQRGIPQHVGMPQDQGCAVRVNFAKLDIGLLLNELEMEGYSVSDDPEER